MGKFFETFEIRCDTMKIKVKLVGESVQPSLELNPESELNLGHCIVGESLEKELNIKNTSPFSIDVFVTMSSSMQSEMPITPQAWCN